MLAGLVFGALAGGMGAPADFTATLTPEERTAAGLDKLTPAELERLGAMVERYKSQAAPERPAKAAAQPGWLSALRAERKQLEEMKESGPLVARLDGTLRGFKGRRRFTLDNGQVWLMVEEQTYAGRSHERPEVTIKPGALGIYWLAIPEAKFRAKVKPVRLE